MLDLRPNCELCDCDLAPDSQEAMICSYECTYCRKCALNVLENVCPTCGGNFVSRPIRPKRAWRDRKRLGLGYHPASAERIFTQWEDSEIHTFVAAIKDIPPVDR